jgi:hypothetical protein
VELLHRGRTPGLPCQLRTSEVRPEHRRDDRTRRPGRRARRRTPPSSRGRRGPARMLGRDKGPMRLTAHAEPVRGPPAPTCSGLRAATLDREAPCNVQSPSAAVAASPWILGRMRWHAGCSSWQHGHFSPTQIGATWPSPRPRLVGPRPAPRPGLGGGICLEPWRGTTRHPGTRSRAAARRLRASLRGASTPLRRRAEGRRSRETLHRAGRVHPPVPGVRCPLPGDRAQSRASAHQVRTAMTDLALALATVAFFVIAILIVRALDRF